MSNKKGSSIVFVMMVLFGLSLIAVSLSSVLSSAASSLGGRIVRMDRANQSTQVAWGYLISHVDNYFAFKDLDFNLDYSKLPLPFAFFPGRAHIEIYHLDFDPSTGKNEELLGWNFLEPGYDPNTVGVYFYSVLVQGKEGYGPFSGPGSSARFNIFVKQLGLKRNSG